MALIAVALVGIGIVTEKERDFNLFSVVSVDGKRFFGVFLSHKVNAWRSEHSP